MKLSRKLWIAPPIAAGVLVYLGVVGARSEPVQSAPRERAVAVRTQTVAPSEVVPRAVGYGFVEPARTWRAVAEVAGRIVDLHPKLAVGEMIPAGTLLVRLDSTEYELRVARLEADLRSIEAERDKLEVGAQNTDASLEVARASLTFAERELERLEGLETGGVVSTSSIDAQQQAVLRERATVVELESSQRMAEADRGVLDAKIASTSAQIEEARLQLERTAIRSPFDFRVASVHVQEAQFVGAGSVLLDADGLETAEIPVALSVESVRRLLPPARQERAVLAGEDGAAWDRLGLTATVRLSSGGVDATWPARLARVAGFVDTSTRTVTLVAAVDDAYRGAARDGRPPLSKGMFVEVEFAGPPLADRVAIARSAVHEDAVFLVDKEQRLVVRPVVLDFVQFDEAVLQSGLIGGEQLVLTDLIPAVPGMLLAPLEGGR